jgi:hypothetical protein
MLDTIVKSLFPTLDRLEAKINQLEKDVKQILEAVKKVRVRDKVLNSLNNTNATH